jgi:hypothetical protein
MRIKLTGVTGNEIKSLKGEWVEYRRMTIADIGNPVGLDTRDHLVANYMNATDVKPEYPVDASEVTRVRIRARINLNGGTINIVPVTFGQDLKNGEVPASTDNVLLTATARRDGNGANGLYYTNVVNLDIESASMLDIVVPTIAVGVNQIILEIQGN